MSHELVGDATHGYRFNYQGKPGWHHLGDHYAEGESPTAEGAVGKATIGVNVVKVPISYTVPVTRADGTEDFVVHTSKKQFAVVRLPIPEDKQNREFGIVGSSWKLESYQDCAKVFNKLTETYPVETCGLIKHGSVCFLALKAEDWDVDGDKMISYLIIQLSMQPGESHRVLHSNVRVVCDNTLQMAIGSAALNIKIPHQADSLEQMELASEIIKAFHESKEHTKKVCEGLAQQELTVDEAYSIFCKAYPAPSLSRKLKVLYTAFPDVTERTIYVNNLDADEMATIKLAELRHQQLLGRTDSLRELAVQKYKTFDTPRFANTAWAAFNAAAEVSDHREGRNQYESAFAGSRAAEKTRAFTAVTELVAKKDETFANLLNKPVAN